MKRLLAQVKKTIVFLGRLDDNGQPEPNATGFLVRIRGVFHLITARHVVKNPESGQLQEQGMCAFYNSKEPGKVCIRHVTELKDQFGVQWVFHSDDNVDIAVIPFPLDPAKDDFRVVPDDLFLSQDDLSELNDIFFLSFQPGTVFTTKVAPVFRSGTISRINDDGTFYIDAAVFPGNSGSPVFLRPSSIQFNEKRNNVPVDDMGVRFIGVIGEYLPYREVASSTQTGRIRIIFEENTGLSRVWSVHLIEEITRSEPFIQQLERMRRKQGIPR